MIIKYKFSTSEVTEVEVSEVSAEIAEVIYDSRRMEHASNERHRYRTAFSLDDMDYEDKDYFSAADNPDDVEAQLAVADIDMIGGQIQDAFDRLLDFVAAGHKADIEPVRKRLLEYFTIPEPTDERLKRARRRLATLMY